MPVFTAQRFELHRMSGNLDISNYLRDVFEDERLPRLFTPRFAAGRGAIKNFV
jgi:hypothetical protein